MTLPHNLSHHMSDEACMQRAFAIALQGRITAPPNPWVGCLIVKEGAIVGEGSTQAPGKDHAEIVALKQAGKRAQNATLFVTLEPCSHFGQTPPCVTALIKAKVKRVVIAMLDPDEKVQGQGVQALKEAGISVTVGVEEEKARQILYPYVHHRTTGTPLTLLKAAISVDGKTAASDATSKWITSLQARQEAHKIRAESQAILIGAKTALIDQPMLTIRGLVALPSKPPLRVIVDGSGELPVAGPLFDLTLAPTLIFTSEQCPKKRLTEWRAAGAEVEFLPQEENNSALNLKEMLKQLGKRGVLQLLVEGGATLQSSFLKAGLANRLIVYIGPKLIGGDGLSAFSAFKTETIDQAVDLQFLNANLIENCIKIEYKIK